MYKIAVLGDRDSIYGFAALGLDICPVSNADEAAKKLRHLAESGYAVIYVTEAVADEIVPEIARYSERLVPAIVPIPGASGNTGSGIANVKKFVEQAVGSDIIFSGESK
jgi:V/A-type H+-transporting ATPase subunit F